MTGGEMRATQRDLVRRGYDAVSHAYRTDLGESEPGGTATRAMYGAWIDELVAELPAGADVLDIGCGAGVPAAQLLADAGMQITGVDISAVQIDRARTLVPSGTFIRSDIVDFAIAADAFDAVISLYALIHIPLDDQRDLLRRIIAGLRPGGLLLAIVGHRAWTGTEDYLGAPMFWDHADAATYLEWLRADGYEVLWHRFVAEGNVGHELVLARRRRTSRARPTTSARMISG